jgi:hypothetical protein
MDALTTSIIGGFAAIFIAVTIYTIQQFVSKLSIEPIRNLSEIRHDICYNLIFYANRYTSPSTMSIGEKNELGEKLRDSATKIVSKSNVIPWYKFFSFLKIVPSKKNIYLASAELIGISNSLREGHEITNSESRKRVEKYLNIPSKDHSV